jgi:uncharacterized repeat protein (TIGR01451 family)
MKRVLISFVSLTAVLVVGILGVAQTRKPTISTDAAADPFNREARAAKATPTNRADAKISATDPLGPRREPRKLAGAETELDAEAAANSAPRTIRPSGAPAASKRVFVPKQSPIDVDDEPAIEDKPAPSRTAGRLVKLGAPDNGEPLEPAAETDVAEREPARAESTGGEAELDTLQSAETANDASPTFGRKTQGITSNPSFSAAEPEGTGRPGERQLEGLQAPTLTIEKSAPAEVQVGKAATIEIKVHNVGKTSANAVQIVDQVPAGTRLMSTTPPAAVGPRGELKWELGSLHAGHSTTVKVEVMPLVEGPIGSVASLVFRADASARSMATKPLVALQVEAPEQVMIGEAIILKLTVSNPGTGVAAGVVIEADIPPGAQHEAGSELEFEVGSLQPKESRQLELTMMAAKAGDYAAKLVARADAIDKAEASAPFSVLAPELKVAVAGSKRKFLDRKAEYTISIANPGTASAKNVELVTYLPKGMKFVEANNDGTYDAQHHAVFWSLEELPAAKRGDVKLTAIPTEPGEQKLRIEGRAGQGLNDRREETVLIEGVAAVSFQVTDQSDPIEVGGEVVYEIRVTNTGSKSATNVHVSALLPKDLKAVDADGPTTARIGEDQITFEPLSRLAPKEEKTYLLKAQATAGGDMKIRVQVQSDEMRQPVAKEENTSVFSDQ